MLRDRLLGSVFLKTIRDWLLWTIIAMVALWGISALYIGMMSATGDEYISLMEDMPDAFANIYGQHGGTAEGLAVSGIYFVMAPLIFLTYAIGLGASAAVGEEESRTLPLLLSSPVRLRSVLVSKAVVVVLGLLLLSLTTWLGAQVFAAAFGMDLSELGVLATAVQLLGMVFLFGAIALGISAWRGSSALGIGVAAGVAVASYFITTLLPVVEELADVARLTPWYLFSGAQSLSDGIDVALLAIALALAAAFGGLGLYALDRRDLRG